MKNQSRMNRRQAQELVQSLVELSAEDKRFLPAVLRLRSRLKQRPMAGILAKVPGETLTQRAKHIGVSRQAYYDWLGGRCRPNAKQAQRLEEITGIAAKIIRGR
jgi:transcriptional regulator with XRE-family HTH domain